MRTPNSNRWAWNVAGTVAALALVLAAAPQGSVCTATPNVQTVGTSTSGAFGAPSLGGVGTPQVGVPGSFHFEITGGAPFAPGVLLLARNEQPLFSPTFGATIWTGPYVLSVPFVCDGNGHAFVMPGRTSAAVAQLCGLDLISQATVFDFTATGGATWTNALRFRFGS